MSSNPKEIEKVKSSRWQKLIHKCKGCYWEKIGPTIPIKFSGDDFSSSYHGHFALGRCKVCGREKLRKCDGSFSWYKSEEMTSEEYMEKYGEGWVKWKA